MAATVPCVPACCSTTQTVNIPGEEGPAGPDGANGVNAYGLVTVPFDVPAVGATVDVAVDNGIWMVQGQKVVFDGPATFEVVSVNSPTSVTLEFMGYADDVAVGTTIPVDAGVSPSGTQPALNTVAAYAEGAGDDLTTTDGPVTFATTDPAITLTSGGTWLLMARIRIDNGSGNATVAGETLTFKLHRTSGPAGDIDDTTAVWEIATVVNNGRTLFAITLPPVVYLAQSSADDIALYADVSAIANAGAYVPMEASIVAVKIS